MVIRYVACRIHARHTAHFRCGFPSTTPKARLAPTEFHQAQSASIRPSLELSEKPCGCLPAQFPFPDNRALSAAKLSLLHRDAYRLMFESKSRRGLKPMSSPPKNLVADSGKERNLEATRISSLPPFLLSPSRSVYTSVHQPSRATAQPLCIAPSNCFHKNSAAGDKRRPTRRIT
jgi:hypothetical protein